MKILLVFFIMLMLALQTEVHPFQLNNSQSEIVKVTIEGAVEDPGVIELNRYDTIADALEKVHLKDEADLTSFNQNQILNDKDVLIIPEKNDQRIQVSINHGTLDDLITLPGIGESTALKIIEYRNENGGYQKIEDLLQVKGIGEKKLESIREYISL